jgi:hypothetical protein
MSWVDKELSLAALTGAVTGVAVMIPIVGDGAWSWIGLFMSAVVATGDPVRDAAGFPMSLIVLAVIAAVTYVFSYLLAPAQASRTP